jgi:hypothetical protein
LYEFYDSLLTNPKPVAALDRHFNRFKAVRVIELPDYCRQATSINLLTFANKITQEIVV